MDLRGQLERTLGGTHTIEQELEGGGMSCVFVATETALGRRVVIKMLAPELAHTVSGERFRREMKLASRLQHPHIVPLLGTGSTVDGLPYYTMPFIEGETLRARLERGGEMPIAEVRTVIRGLASALAFAHERGIVHRDIKPENIVFAGETAMVMDFGVAKALSDSAIERTSMPRTTAGTAVGTPAYMSPEQAAGDPATDHRADLYALGIVCYEMLTGHAPFEGRPFHRMLAAHVTEMPEDVAKRRPTTPPALAALVMRCLAKSPADRPPSARDVLAAVDPSATPSEPVTVAPIRRTPRAVAWILVLLLLALIALAVYATAHRTGSAPKRLAVLPFENAGDDSTQEYFSDGITDEVTTELANVEGLSVIARTSAFALKGRGLSPRKVGDSLHAEVLVAGKVTRAGDRVHVNADLVSTGDGATIWSHAFESGVADLPLLQREIVDSIVGSLRVKLSSRAHAVAHVPTPEVRDLYLRGRFFLNRGTKDDITRALSYFRQATERDTAYAAAFAGLAWTYSILADAYLSPGEANPRAIAAAERALRLDDGIGEAHALLGTMKVIYGHDDAGGKREFDRAIEINPSDAFSHGQLAMYWMNRMDTATTLIELRTSLELDPLSSLTNVSALVDFVLIGQADSAIACYHRGLELDPAFIYIEPCVDEAYRAKGMYTEALAADRRAERLLGRPPTGMVLTLVATRRRAEAAETLARIKESAKRTWVPPELIARAHLALGQRDSALAWIERGIVAESAFGMWLNWAPEFHGAIRADPRFQGLLKWANLPIMAGTR